MVGLSKMAKTRPWQPSAIPVGVAGGGGGIPVGVPLPAEDLVIHSHASGQLEEMVLFSMRVCGLGSYTHFRLRGPWSGVFACCIFVTM